MQIKPFIKTSLTVLAGIFSVVSLISCTYASFTDRELSAATLTTGSIEFSIDNLNELEDEYSNNTFLPGEARLINTTINNNGTLSTDVQFTITISHPLRCSEYDFINNSNYRAIELYDYYDINLFGAENQNNSIDGSLNYYPYAVYPGAESIEPTNISVENGIGIITYTFDYLLDGYGDESQVDSYMGLSGYATNSMNNFYCIIFKEDPSYMYYNIPVDVNISLSAKQHRNTDNNSEAWFSVYSDNFKFNQL